MLLKEGMQVRVVLFPDGHDPDSYARQVSSDELKQYLSQAARDFIVFKTDILAGDAAGDPIKRAAMVREIVSSIALIPDAIQRSVYTQECSRLLEIPEQTLISEINKDLRNRMLRQEREGFRGEEPAGQPMPQEMPQPVLVELVGPPHEEEEFVRLLLSYGDIELTLRMSWETEEQRYPAEETATELAAFLISECVFDGIQFENDLCARIVEEYDGFLRNHLFPPEKYFTTHSEQQVCEFVARVLTARYDLSENWDLFHNIQVESEIANIKEAATVAVNKLKLRKVLNECDDIDRRLHQDKELTDEEINLLLSRKIRLNNAKANLSAYFQTVILR
jgi:DNA primase